MNWLRLGISQSKTQIELDSVLSRLGRETGFSMLIPRRPYPLSHPVAISRAMQKTVRDASAPGLLSCGCIHPLDSTPYFPVLPAHCIHMFFQKAPLEYNIRNAPFCPPRTDIVEYSIVLVLFRRSSARHPVHPTSCYRQTPDVSVPQAHSTMQQAETPPRQQSDCFQRR